MNYTIEASAPGFKKLVRSRIVLRVDDNLDLRLVLDLGSASESVNVTASAKLLEESSNTVGQVVAEQTMQQLPLNGRNYLQLGNLTAEAVPSTRSQDRFRVRQPRSAERVPALWRSQSELFRGLDNRARDAMRPSLKINAQAERVLLA